MISFAAPWLLAGLAAAALPVVLHLVARREPPEVSFPAVRYLEDTARRHQRRVHLQHWLLLAVRTLLIVLIVLAAAGPSMAGAGPGTRAPSALVLVVDNSLSSAAVREGEATLETLRRAAARVLDRAVAGDDLWLVTAGPTVVAGEATTLRRAMDSLAPEPLRLDLGEALSVAAELLRGSTLPGEIALLSDLQRTATGAAEVTFPVVVGVPVARAPANLGITRLETGSQPWLSTGQLTISAGGDQTGSRPVAVRLGGRTVRQGLIESGADLSVALVPPGPGWHVIEVALDPDELRLDDLAHTAVRVAHPAAVSWDSGDRYLGLALEVLLANGRVVRGDDITVGHFGSGASVVLPPADAAGVGALNRALEGRGVPWAFDVLPPSPARTDSSSLLGPVDLRWRYRLRPLGEGGEVLVTANGEPWLVREGRVVLLGSRLDPAWTDLPFAAGFMPFVDVLINRLGRGELPVRHGTPGMPMTLPGQIRGVASPSGVELLERESRYLPREPGVHWLLRDDADTSGVVIVSVDPREGELAPADPDMVRALWPTARVVPADDVAALTFIRHGRADLRGPLLLVALVLGGVEALLGWARPRSAA